MKIADQKPKNYSTSTCPLRVEASFGIAQKVLNGTQIHARKNKTITKSRVGFESKDEKFIPNKKFRQFT
jgi:hypothetical protein